MNLKNTTGRVLCLVAATAVVVAGCSGGTSSDHLTSDVTGSPHAVTHLRTNSSSAPATASVPATASSRATGTGSCAKGADFCDTFSDDSSGWPVTNAEHYFAAYDSYLGGTYRLGERTNSTISEDAPFDIHDVANDSSVQVDVDATLAQQMPADDLIGITCWEHEIADGGGAVSAFVLEASQGEAKIGLWDDINGDYHEIASSKVGAALDPSGTNHLTAVCVQGVGRSGVQAELALKANGKTLVTATYPKTDRTYDWNVGSSVGVLAAGEGSDVFYDNFAVTSRCQSYC